MPRIRSGAITGAAWLAGLPWRVKPGRGKPLLPSDPHLRRVVIIKPCCMGDVLMSTPAIAALRAALPESHITLAVGDYSRPAVLGNPRLNELIESPVGGERTIMAHYLRLARQIRRGNYGAALVLDRSPLLNMVPYMAGVPVRAGLDSDNRGLALTHAVACPPDEIRHEVEWYLEVVRALGLPAPREEAFLEFFPSADDEKEANTVLREAVDEESESGMVAIHLGGGANPGMSLLSKRWQPDRWARVADWLAETHEPTILLLGGPSKEDRMAAEIMKGALFPATRPYVVDLVGKLQWGAMAALLRRCRLFLGHDTGAMHLATAVRTPVVAVFGPSNPVRYGPWDPSRMSVVVAPGRASEGAEALRLAADAEGTPYHNLVSTDSVWAAVEKLYGRTLQTREQVTT